MHISEGVCSLPVLAAGWAVTLGGLAVGLRRADHERLPRTALLAAVFFVASLVHVPLGPVSVHLIMNGLAGLVLGWAAFPAIFAGLALQALLFQYGGLAVLGVNAATMSLGACLAALPARPLVASGRPAAAAAGGFLAGGLGVLLAGVFTASALAGSGEELWGSAAAILMAHVPVMIIEGIVGSAVAVFLRKVQPGLLTSSLQTKAI